MTVRAHIARAIRARNRELAFEAVIEIVVGLVFCGLMFGFVFGVAFLLSFALPSVGLPRWATAGIVTGVFILVSSFSAWRRVDPLREVAPMTPQQFAMTMVSLATPGFVYVSPRHAIAGTAAFLIGGPANLFSALATWRHRLPSATAVIDAAAQLLPAAEASAVPLERIDDVRAALVLHRLALVKVIDPPALATTEKGREMLADASGG